MTPQPTDYGLRVSIGPNYSIDKMLPIHVNEESNPTLIDSPYFKGHTVVRVLEFTGISHSNHVQVRNPQSSYFTNRNRRYSIMIQGQFKESFNGDDIIFGIQFDTPIRLPTGWGLGLKVAQWLDPNIVADLASKEPFIFSPLLCAMNSISILNNHSEIKSLLQDFSPNKKQLSKQPSTNTSQIESLNNLQKDESLDQVLAGDIGEWGYSSQFVPEDTSILFKDTNENVKKPDLQTYEKRKKYFGDSKKRQAVTFEKGKLFSMDFYDAYVDFNNFQIKLPGFSLSAFRYWDGQPLRFTAKTRCGKILFCVNFELLLKDETEIGKYRVEEEKESTSSPEQEIIDDGDSVKENSESIYESAEDEDSNDQMKDISNSFEKI